MKKSFLIYVFLILFFSCRSQNLKGLWQNQDNLSIYDCYESKIVYDFSGDNISSVFYGFYESRFLPSIDSLKTEGNYYFEVSPDDFDQKNKDAKGHYRGVIAHAMEFSEDGNAFITYDIMRPGQQSNYKRVKVIPAKIASYLKAKGIEILDNSKANIRIIQTQKSTIYKTPNIPTKMYLLKGNEVEVLEQKDNWLHIRYYGNKTIEGWIKKEDVGEK